MNYDTIIKTISDIIANDNIYKEGLILIYELDDKIHKQLDEELFIKLNGNLINFEHQDVFEIELGGIIVKFIKKYTKIIIENLDD